MTDLIIGNNITALVIGIIITAYLITVVLFTKIIKKYSSEKLDLKIKLIHSETRASELASYSVSLIEDSKKLTLIDDTSKKLILLAVNNLNENESRNAAVKACKRLVTKFK